MVRERLVNIGLNIAERLVSSKRFSPESHQDLELEGLKIYTLLGGRIKDILKISYFSSLSMDRLKKNPDVANLRSRRSEVAFSPDPELCFLPGSNGQDRKEQERLIDEYSNRLTKKVRGVRAIMGDAPDYLELLLWHTVKTKENLFDKKRGEHLFDSPMIRTATKIGSEFVYVGDHFFARSINNDLFVPGMRPDKIWAFPLVIPA